MKMNKNIFNLDEKFLEVLKNENNISDRILLSNNLSGIEVVDIALEKKLNAVLQNSIFSLQEKLSLLHKIDVENIFDPDFPIIESKPKFFDYKFQDDRVEIINALFELFGVNLRYSKNSELYNVAQELMMNANNAILAAQSDQKNVEGLKLIFECNNSKNLFAISVIDPAGVLAPYSLLQQIQSVFNKGFKQGMSKKKEGAGLGSSIIFNSCDTLIMVIKPQVSTRVTVVLPYLIAQKKIDQIQKSLMIIGG